MSKPSTYIAIFLACFLTACSSPHAFMHKSDFVYVSDLVEDIAYDMRYAGNNNFIGRPINGYQPKAEPIMTRKAAAALGRVQYTLRSKGFALKIFDAYRPQKAVNHFIKWAADPADTKRKHDYYPDIPKDSLFHKGYIAERSGHTRGSTVDLTMIDMNTGKELDMGGPFDFFGELSHHDYRAITDQQQANRRLLRQVMEQHGFRAYEAEWWHYTLETEPYPDRYFNFDVIPK